MSSDHPSEQPPTGPSPRRWLRYFMNAGIVCFFVVGVGVAAGSFGLFGCYCIGGPPMTAGNVVEKAPDPPAKGGDMPPLPSTPK